MNALPHHRNAGRSHSHNLSPRKGKVMTADDDQHEEELLRLYNMLEAKRAAKRSAEVSTSLLREDDINSAEKNDTRRAGAPATFGGDGVPTDAGSPSEAPLSEPILPTVESVAKSSSGSAASVMTNPAKTPWTPTLPSTSYGGSSMSDKSYSIFTRKEFDFHKVEEITQVQRYFFVRRWFIHCVRFHCFYFIRSAHRRYTCPGGVAYALTARRRCTCH